VGPAGLSLYDAPLPFCDINAGVTVMVRLSDKQ
jgi:hypothetical protein